MHHLAIFSINVYSGKVKLISNISKTSSKYFINKMFHKHRCNVKSPTSLSPGMSHPEFNFSKFVEIILHVTLHFIKLKWLGRWCTGLVISWCTIILKYSRNMQKSISLALSMFSSSSFWTDSPSVMPGFHQIKSTSEVIPRHQLE